MTTSGPVGTAGTAGTAHGRRSDEHRDRDRDVVATTGATSPGAVRSPTTAAATQTGDGDGGAKPASEPVPVRSLRRATPIYASAVGVESIAGQAGLLSPERRADAAVASPPHASDSGELLWSARGLRRSFGLQNSVAQAAADALVIRSVSDSGNLPPHKGSGGIASRAITAADRSTNSAPPEAGDPLSLMARRSFPAVQVDLGSLTHVAQPLKSGKPSGHQVAISIPAKSLLTARAATIPSSAATTTTPETAGGGQPRRNFSVSLSKSIFQPSAVSSARDGTVISKLFLELLTEPPCLKRVAYAGTMSMDDLHRLFVQEFPEHNLRAPLGPICIRDPQAGVYYELTNTDEVVSGSVLRMRPPASSALPTGRGHSHLEQRIEALQESLDRGFGLLREQLMSLRLARSAAIGGDRAQTAPTALRAETMRLREHALALRHHWQQESRAFADRMEQTKQRMAAVLGRVVSHYADAGVVRRVDAVCARTAYLRAADAVSVQLDSAQATIEQLMKAGTVDRARITETATNLAAISGQLSRLRDEHAALKERLRQAWTEEMSAMKQEELLVGHESEFLECVEMQLQDLESTVAMLAPTGPHT